MRKTLLILCCLPLLAIAQEQRKLALVIGNANYEDPNGVLTNPLNDSRLMSETFEALEFDSVIVANDLTYDAMRSAFSNYKRALRNDFDVGFIYYSGHGTQDDYKNTYLLPVDFPSDPTIDDVEEQAYDFQRFLKSLEKIEGKLNIIILDACRNNPFEKGWKGKSATGLGLAEPEEPANGTLIAYSTAPGYTANDNKNLANSIYTATLAEIMKQPNQKIEDIFKKVRSIVRKESEKLGKIQSPQLYGEYEGDLYLLIKEDYSKIEVKDIEKKAEKLKKEEQNIFAIEQYNLLEIYFKTNIQNIDRRKLLNLYFDMGEIYFRLRTDTNLAERIDIEKKQKDCDSQQCWDNTEQEIKDLKKKYSLLSRASYYNALLLFKELSIDKVEYKDLYSKILFNYIWSSEGEKIDYSMLEHLMEFNINNFGEDNYRTALVYYISSFFNYDDYSRYQLRLKCANLILKNTYSEEDVKEYMLNSMALKSIVVNSVLYAVDDFNENMKASYYSEKGNDTAGCSQDFKMIENAFRDLKQNIDSDDFYAWREKEMLEHQATFYHNFPVYHYYSMTSDKYEYCTLKAIDINDNLFALQANASDSCYVLSNNMILLENLARIYYNRDLNYDSISFKRKDLIVKALDLCLERSVYDLMFMFLQELEESYYYHYKDSVNYSAEEQVMYLDKINEIFPSVMAQYREDENQDYESDILWSYFINSQWRASELKEVFDQNRKFQFLENWLSYVLSSKKMGYGSYQMIEVKLKIGYTYANYGKEVKADNMFREMLNDIDKKKHTWTFEDQPEWRINTFQDLDGLILAKYLDVYDNYFSNFGQKYADKDDMQEYGMQNIDRTKDSLLLWKYENMLIENKEKLQQMNYYYGPYSKLLYAKAAFDWFTNTENVIHSYDLEIEMLKELKKDSALWGDIGGNPWTIYKIENNLYYAFGNKTKKLEEDNQVAYRLKCIEESKKWEQISNVFFIMDQYDAIVDYYIYKKDENKILKYVNAGIDFGEDYILTHDFSDFTNSKLSKADIIQKIANFYQLKSDGSFSSKTSTNASREECIDYTKGLIHYVIENWTIDEIKDSEYLISYLYKSCYTVADNYWFMHDNDSTKNYIDSTIVYHKKYLEYTKKIMDNDLRHKKTKHALNLLRISYSKIDDIDSAVYYYKQYIKHDSWLDEDFHNNVAYQIIEKEYDECIVKFLEVTVKTVSNAWPLLEFDINQNNKIDSLVDVRYFVAADSELHVEYIKSLDPEFGSYIYAGYDDDGNIHDTTDAIIFDATEEILSNAYLQKNDVSINYAGEFGERKVGSEAVNWIFMIPLDELQVEDSTNINFIVSSVTYNNDYFRQSRLFNKHMHPLKSYFSGFSDAYTISLDNEVTKHIRLLKEVKTNTGKDENRKNNIDLLNEALLNLKENKDKMLKEEYVVYRWKVLEQISDEYLYDDKSEKAIEYLDSIISFLRKEQIKTSEFDYEFICANTEYIIARIYSNLNDFSNSKLYYEKSYNHMKNNGEYLNNYSWFLVENGKELENALVMSYRSLEIHSDRDYFWDTYAFILYKLNDFEKAKQAIFTALELNGNRDQEYLVKAGDIYFALNENVLALKYWELAVRAGGEKTEEIKTKIYKINN